MTDHATIPDGHKTTIASLEQELQCACVQFDLLNENRDLDPGDHKFVFEDYRWLPQETEARITLLGERIAAIHRILAYLRVKGIGGSDSVEAIYTRAG